MSKRLRALYGATAAAVLVGASTMAPAYADPNNNNVQKLTSAVTVHGVMSHLEALQGLADDNGGNRAAGLPGYAASVGYVVDQLRGAGYDPQVQEFTFD